MTPKKPRKYMVFEIPVNITSEANWRGHHMARHSRFKKQRDWVMLCFTGRGPFYGDRYRVILTRIKGPKQRNFDGDNLQSAFKAIRDAVAKQLGIDDGSDRIIWSYRQEKGGEAAVRVDIWEDN